MDPDQHELDLRAHVRHLLLDYAKIHLTKDYITFTEDAVSELLSECLFFIPTTDPNSLTLPEDPFDTLSRTYGLPDLKPYDEKWPADRDAVHLLRNTLTFSGKPRTERCWDDEDKFDYNASIYRPMSPILTTRAIHQTPKPGSAAALKSMPKSQRDALKSFECVEMEVIEEPAQVKLEEALNLRLAIDSTTHSSILGLYKSVPEMFPLRTAHINSHVDAFLLSDSPPPALPQLEFVPMFARADRLGGAQTSNTLKPVHHSAPNALSDLPSMLPESKVEDDEEKELYKQHMVIVDGWQTFAPSSPSSIGTPSLGSGTSEIDELFLMSPPGTQPALVQELMASRIDETEIPRNRKIGGTIQKSKFIGESQSLGSFLSPFVSGLPVSNEQASNPRIVTTPRSSPRSSIGLSMLGQPSSLLETTETYRKKEDQDMDLDVAVSQLYAETRGNDPADLILKERLDEKGGMLMDVPIMPQPNVHPSNPMFLPTNMRALLHPSINTESLDDYHGFLKNVTGIKSLNIELSWRPFQFGSKIPTDEEVARVEGGIQDSEVENFVDIDKTKVAVLLEGAAVSNLVDSNIFRGWECLDNSIKPIDLTRVESFEVMLTREERRRLAGVPDDIHDDADESLADPVMPRSLDDFNINSGDKGNKGAESPDLLANGQAKRLDCEWDGVLLDDSGVSVAHPAGVVDNNTSSQDQFVDDDFPLGEDKENVPPVPDYSMSQPPFDTQGSYPDHDRFSFGERMEDAGYGAFVPLSFDSSHAHSNYQSQHLSTEQEIIRDDYAGPIPYQDKLPVSEGTAEIPIGQTSTLTDVLLHAHSHHVSESTPDVLLIKENFAGRSLAEFLALRNKHVKQDSFNLPVITQTAEIASEPIPDGSLSETQVTPESIFDRNTLRLPSPWLLPTTLHRYLASVDLLQKRSMVRSLGVRECAVELVERDTLGGVDLILDPHTTVIFASLMALPSQCEALIARLGEQSWRFARLLVIFEAFSSSLAYKSDPASTRLTPSAYTPPILKAIKKFRRDLGIAEALETKNVRASIHFAFADSVHEAALFTRCFGDCAEANDTTGGAIWGPREWLDVEEQEGEQDLGCVDGMNVFAASIILCQKPLQVFLDSATEIRALEFGHLIGRERVTLFNEVIGHPLHRYSGQRCDPLAPT